MYLDCETAIPDVPGKINKVKKGGTTYVRYVVGRTYHAIQCPDPGGARSVRGVSTRPLNFYKFSDKYSVSDFIWTPCISGKSAWDCAGSMGFSSAGKP
jgi:hypothetical protein